MDHFAAHANGDTEFSGGFNDSAAFNDDGDLGAATNGATDTAVSKKEQQAKELADNLAKLKEQGWNNPIPFNYQTVYGGEAGADEPRDEAKWLSNAAIYEWDDDFGEVGPPNEELEKVLFHGEYLMRAGVQLEALAFDVEMFGPEKVHPISKFDDAGLHPVMRENIRLCRYVNPTPIQCYCIPAVLTGRDVVACAQTGSGKTAAYLIPILSKLMGKARMLAAPRPNPTRYNPVTDRVRAEPLVLVVCPTRELACQIFDECRRLCYRTMLRPCVIYGGAPTRGQREQLEMGCDILIATPGRLLDFMRNPGLLSFARLKFTVIDEADELFSGGWEETIESLFQGNGTNTNADADHMYLMFSATFPKLARRMARDYMDEDYVRIKVGRVGSTHTNIHQDVIYVDEGAKNQCLFDLIFSGGPQRTLIFVNTKVKCDMVDDFLYNKGLPSTSIHSDRTQREREDALRAFRTAKCPILVATGVSARGLDVTSVKHVINYDLPSTQHDGITEYIHRIGRTARIGNEGKATSFFNDRNEDIAPDLCKILAETKQEIPEFLQSFAPEDPKNIQWHDNTDDENEAEVEAGAVAGFGGGFDCFGDNSRDVNDTARRGFQPEEGFQTEEGFQAESPWGDNNDKMGTW
ncbi:P-loop containing nucleoside triphosphate hydrolase protein [Lojkania enalia]|uniref:RNA helicase n=1 Tax=Lojkania enalia TaxID=147567 RepID=A0A9P4ND93_9PLEO|nr:P-loop containing nucleoside triphosphate hydrolase protein [Didymosphaeria enalia]